MSCWMLEKRALETTCLRTRTVSKAASRDPTTCLRRWNWAVYSMTTNKELTVFEASPLASLRLYGHGLCAVLVPLHK